MENDGKNTVYAYNDPENRGHFRKGNPGRPLGAKGRTKASITTALHDRAEAALIALDTLIAAGNDKAILYVLERTAPKGGRTLELHGSEPEDVEAALVAGHLSPDEAKTLTQTLLALKGLRDLTDLQARLAALESLLQDDGADGS